MKLIEYLFSKVNEFLRDFQTDQPIVPFLAETLETLIMSFMNMFILKNVMDKTDTLMILLKVDVKDKNLYKTLGHNRCRNGGSLQEVNKFKETTLKSFLNGVHITMSILVQHILENFSLKYRVLSNKSKYCE